MKKEKDMQIAQRVIMFTQSHQDKARRALSKLSFEEIWNLMQTMELYKEIINTAMSFLTEHTDYKVISRIDKLFDEFLHKEYEEFKNNLNVIVDDFPNEKSD